MGLLGSRANAPSRAKQRVNDVLGSSGPSCVGITLSRGGKSNPPFQRVTDYARSQGDRFLDTRYQF